MRSGSNSNSLVANYSTEFEKIEANNQWCSNKKVSSSICIQYNYHAPFKCVAHTRLAAAAAAAALLHRFNNKLNSCF